MTRQARREESSSAPSPREDLGDEGAERYMWAFPEGNHVVLTIPGLRDLKLDPEEARTIGKILAQTADEITEHHKNHTEGGESHGSTEEHPASS